MTTETLEPVKEDTDTDIYAAVNTVWRQYRQWVSRGELHLALENHLFLYPELLGETPNRLRKLLSREAEKYARQRKAAKCGYRVDDEAFYSMLAIRRLLPYALDPNAVPPPTVADELMAEVNRNHAGKEGYGGWEVAVADVRTGLKATSSQDRALLVVWLASGTATGWLARKMGLEPAVVSGRIRRIVRAIQRRLGGVKP